MAHSGPEGGPIEMMVEERQRVARESFFGTLKTELLHQGEYPDRDTARRDPFASIEAYHNRQRRHSAIGYITPEQAEAKSA